MRVEAAAISVAVPGSPTCVEEKLGEVVGVGVEVGIGVEAKVGVATSRGVGVIERGTGISVTEAASPEDEDIPKIVKSKKGP